LEGSNGFAGGVLKGVGQPTFLLLEGDIVDKEVLLVIAHSTLQQLRSAGQIPQLHEGWVKSFRKQNQRTSQKQH